MFQYFWILVIIIAIGIILITVIEDMISAIKKTWSVRKTIHSFVEFLITYFSFLNFATKAFLVILLFYLFSLSIIMYHNNHLSISDVEWFK